MQVLANEIDDFKTERKDILPPLPQVFRLVPILFYLSLIFVVLISAIAAVHTKVANDRLNDARKRVADLKTEIEGLKTQRSNLEAQIRGAAELEGWVMAAAPIQPLVVAISESMDARLQSTIVELKLERDVESPSQLKLGLRLNTTSEDQLQRTLEAVRSLGFLEFSPTQSMVRGDLDYRATLLWQQPNSEEPAAAGETSAAAQP
jgi:cell division protein FtsL